MCDGSGRFIDLAMRGDVAADDIDDFIDAWHEAPPGQSLHEFLGMTTAEYDLWLHVPDALPDIVRARQSNRQTTSERV